MDSTPLAKVSKSRRPNSSMRCVTPRHPENPNSSRSVRVRQAMSALGRSPLPSRSAAAYFRPVQRSFSELRGAVVIRQRVAGRLVRCLVIGHDIPPLCGRCFAERRPPQNRAVGPFLPLMRASASFAWSRAPRLPREAGVLRARPAEPPRDGIASGPSV